VVLAHQTLETLDNQADLLEAVVDMVELQVELVIFLQYLHHKEILEEHAKMKKLRELEVLVVVVHRLQEQIVHLVLEVEVLVPQYLGYLVQEFIHYYQVQSKVQLLLLGEIL
jgi:hypothetical protein